MSAQKTVSSLLQQQERDDEDHQVLKRAHCVANDVNEMNTELLGNVRPIDVVAQNFEEVAILKEFRCSKMNFKLEKIKFLKSKMSKSFGV